MTNKMNVLLLPLAVCFPCFSKYNVFPLTVAFPILTVQVILGRLILLGTATLSNISTCCHQTSGYVSFFRWFSSYVSSKGSVSFAATVIFDSCSDQTTISGRNIVYSHSGIKHFLPMSALMFHLLPLSKMKCYCDFVT